MESCRPALGGLEPIRRQYNFSAYSGGTFKIAKVGLADSPNSFIVSTYVAGVEQLVIFVSVSLRSSGTFYIKAKNIHGTNLSDYSFGYDNEHNIYLKRNSDVILGSVKHVLGTAMTYYNNTSASGVSFTPVTIE